MPGVWGIVSEKPLAEKMNLSNAFHKEKCTTYLENCVDYDKSAFGRCSINKFQNDKIFEETQNYLICTDGIIFNLKDLLVEGGYSKFSDYLMSTFMKDRNGFMKKLRGNFAGYIYIKETHELVIFNDHLGSKPIYYYFDEGEGTLIFASEQKGVIEGMRRLGNTPHLSTTGAYCLLTFGFMIKDNTLVAEIKKIPPGNILTYKKNKISFIQYYRLSSTPYNNEGESELIRNLDRLFRTAVKMEYEKDLEYGYKHISTLSGGLDSRMNVAIALKMGFTDIACFTFSESNYLDETIAKEISSDNHLKFIFYALDNGDYLTEYLDDIICLNDGLTLYSGIAHAYACSRSLNFCNMGMVHTGQIGDLIMGSYLTGPIHNEINDNIINKMAYSKNLLPKLSEYISLKSEDYENDELCAFYERCINGTFSGYRVFEQFTEYSSPFLYIDFLDYAMKISPSYRYRESLYIKWINTSTPDFARYKWEKIKLSPKHSIKFITLYSKIFALKTAIFNCILHKEELSMNPFEHWWKSNNLLRERITTIFKENIDAVKGNTELYNDCIHQFEKGSLLEKTQVITLIRTIKLFDLKIH